MASLPNSPTLDFSARRLGLGGSDLAGSAPCVTSASLGNTSVFIEADVGGVHWNLLREQMSSLSREMNAMRQDINTLRLADSQYEVQNAEMSRHVREMQVQFRADLQNEAARLEKLELNYAVAVPEAQKASRSLNDIQERLIKDVSLVDDRVSKFWGVCEERFAIINQMQCRLEELKVDAKLSSLQGSLNKAMQDVSEALRGELSILKEKPSIDDVRKLCSTSLQEVVVKLAAQEKQSKEAKEDLAKLSTEHQSSTDSMHKTIRDLIAQERSAREKMHGSATDRLQELERRHRDAMSELSNHKDKVSSTTTDALERKIQEISKLTDEKFEALKGLHGHVNAACENLDAKVMSEIRRLSDDHRRLGEDHCKKHQTLQEMMGKFHTDHHAKHVETHTSLSDVVQALEKKMREAMANHMSENDSKHTAHAGNLESMQRRWKEDLAALTSEHNGQHADHKEQLGKFSRDIYKEMSELREMHGRQTTAQKSLIDDHKADSRALMQDMDSKLRREMASLCDELRNQLIEFVAKEKQDREMHCVALGGRLEDVDRKLKDMLVRFSTEQENTYSTLSGMLGVLERKLREELHGVHDDTQGKTADLKDQLQRGLSDHGTRHTELKELVSRVQAEERRAREDHNKGLGTTLEQLEIKLRREISSGSDKQQGHVREHVAQERQLREKAHLMYTERLVEIERKLAAEYSQTALREISTEMREFATNTCSKERAQMQELLQKEQEFRSSQLEAFNKMILQERAAREAQQESLRVYLTNEKMARQSKDKSLLAEVEVQIQRVFREVRNHTHDVQAWAQPQPQQAIVASRSVSPMPRRAVPQTQQMPQTKVTTVAPGAMAVTGVDTSRCVVAGAERVQSEAVPMAVAGVDVNRDGRANYFIVGEDRNRDGVPDVLQGLHGSTTSAGSSPARAVQYVRREMVQMQAGDVSPNRAQGRSQTGSFVTEPGSPLYGSRGGRLSHDPRNETSSNSR